MRKEYKDLLRELLVEGAALAELFAEVEVEARARATTIASMDFDDSEAGPKARKLQGEMRGMIQCLDRMKEIINDD